MSKRYMKYLLKKHKVTLLFIAIMYVMISSFANFGAGNDFAHFRSAVNIAIALNVVLCIVLPVLLFHPLHGRSSSDMYLSLPVSRHEMLVTSYVFMFLITAGTYAMTVLLQTVLSKGIALSGVLLLIGNGILGTAATLLAVTAMFLAANNTIDGLIMIGAYSFFPFALWLAAITFSSGMIAGGQAFFESFPKYLSPFYLTVSNAMEMIYLATGEAAAAVDPICPAVLVLMGILSVWALKHDVILRKSERAEHVSDRIMAYPAVIPAYVLACLVPLAITAIREGFVEVAVWFALLLAVYITATFIYRRSIRITWKTLLVYAGSVLLVFSLAKAAWMTKGFGIPAMNTLRLDRSCNIQYRGYVEEEKKSINRSYTNFELVIPEGNGEKYVQIHEMLEQYRLKCIDEFYEDTSPEGENCMLSVAYRERGTSENRYYYYSVTALSTEELKVISRYADIRIESTDENGEWTVQTLDEYLNTTAES